MNLDIAFWKGAAERAVKTFLQVFSAFILAKITNFTSVFDVAWGELLTTALGTSLMATLVSFLTSITTSDKVRAGNVPVVTGDDGLTNK